MGERLRSHNLRSHGTLIFIATAPGLAVVDVKYLPEPRDRDGATRKRFLLVAIDRCARWVHLVVKDDETTTSAVVFLKEAV